MFRFVPIVIALSFALPFATHAATTAPSSESASSAPRATVAPELSGMGKAQAWMLAHWYEFRPLAGRLQLKSLNLMNVARSDEDLEFWMRVFGYRAIFDAIATDAKDPANRTGTEERKLAQTGECHIVAHFAGRMAYRIFGINALVENTIDTRCAFGFYHGIIESSLGEIGNDAVVTDFAAQCEEYADQIIRRTFCMHAIGHALMVHYDFDLPLALKKCTDLISSDAGKRMCYHGAYMENSFGFLGVGMHDDSTWARSTDPDFPCNSPLLPDYPFVRDMCYANQSVIWGRKKLSNFDEVPAIAGCARAPHAYRSMCFRGLGFNMAFAQQSGTLTDAEVVGQCEKAPTAADAHQCFLGAIMMRATHWDTFTDFKLPTFCTALGKPNLDDCNAYVYEAYSWLKE